MVLYIEITDGPFQGSRFKLESGHRIGRTTGEIMIQDEKISGQHAVIEMDNKGQFVLMDLGSSNGILTGNRRVKKLAMMPGVNFRLGRTNFLVVQAETKEAEKLGLLSWREHLQELLPVAWVENLPPINSGRPFSPSLKLSFIQGVQTDEALLLGYGPRKAGAMSMDIDLLDPEAPPLAFEIIPGDGFAQIVNHCGSKLRVNHKLIGTEILEEGDVIEFGKTLIKVNYL